MDLRNEHVLRRLASFRTMLQRYVVERRPFDEVWANDHGGWLEQERAGVESALISRRSRTYREDYFGEPYFRNQGIGRPYKQEPG